MIQINPNRTIENTFPDSSPKTATDSFETLDGGLVSALTVDMTPVQDLHGYSKPWAGGAGKQKLDYSAVVGSNNGVTFSIADDDGVALTGTASANVYQLCNSNFVLIPGTSYTLNGMTANVRMRIREFDSSNNVLHETYATNIDATFTVDANTVKLDAYIVISSGVATGGEVYPMIRLASVADPTFEPYSNICPISGHTEAKSKINNTVYTTSLGTTVYGGELDMVSGEGESNVGVLSETDFTTVKGQNARGLYYLDFDYVEKDNPQIISNMLETKSSDAGWTSSTPCVAYSIAGGNRFIRVYVAENTVSDFQTNYSGLQIAYPLATPTTLTLTGQNITAEVGENNVSAPLDGQEIQTDGVTYKEMFSWADVVAYVQSQVNP